MDMAKDYYVDADTIKFFGLKEDKVLLNLIEESKLEFKFQYELTSTNVKKLELSFPRVIDNSKCLCYTLYIPKLNISIDEYENDKYDVQTKLRSIGNNYSILITAIEKYQKVKDIKSSVATTKLYATTQIAGSQVVGSRN